ncbi:MAG: hypothetical protein WCE81_05775 [Halobacteriota archaeon]
MTVDTNTIQIFQDICQIVIGAVQDGSIGQIGIWGVHHLKLVTHFLSILANIVHGSVFK